MNKTSEVSQPSGRDRIAPDSDKSYDIKVQEQGGGRDVFPEVRGLR